MMPALQTVLDTFLFFTATLHAQLPRHVSADETWADPEATRTYQ